LITSRRIAAQWAALKPDVLHVNKQNLEDGLDLLRAADLLATPSFSTIHITQSARYLGACLAWLRDALARRWLRSYQGRLIAVQEARHRELSSFLGNDRPVSIVFY